MILLAVLFSIALVLITLKRPVLGLGLAAGADLVLLEGIPIGSLSVAPESFYFLFLLAVPLLRPLVHGPGAPLPFSEVRPLFGFFLLFFGLCLLSSLLGGGLGLAQGVLTRLPLWALFGIAPVWICRRPRDMEIVATAVIWSIFGLLVIGVLTGLPEAADQGGILRTGYLNPLGHSFALASVMCAATLGRGARRYSRTLLMGIFLVGVLWTGSRGAFVSGSLGLFVVGWIKSPGRAKSFAKLAALGGSLLVLFAFSSGFVGAVWDRFLANDASSNLYRYQIMTLSGRLFTSSPILGVGVGSMEASGLFHAQGLRTLTARIIANDNEYARVVAELGSLGVLLLLGWVRFLYQRYVVAVRAMRGVSAERLSVLALGGGVGAYLLALGFFESILFSPTGWFYIGFSWACV
nr:O-antigen ligase family protein [Planctomycetota bacterium]